MLDISLDMLGLGELESDLLRVSSATANKAIRDAVVAGARVARDKSRESAPVRSGTLKRNLVDAFTPVSDSGCSSSRGEHQTSGGQKAR